MGFRAGRLRDRITIRRPTNASDGKGGQVRTWANLAVDLRAEVVSQNGREAVIASALQGINSYRIVIRRRTDLRTSDQILYTPAGAATAQELNIKSATDDPFFPREATVIFADTEAPQGA